MKKILLLLILLIIPFAIAEEDDEDDEDPGWLDWLINSIRAVQDSIKQSISLLPNKILDLVMDIINLPLQPLLFMVKKLLEGEVKINFMKGIWSAIVYVISLLYGLLFIFCGVNLMTSGHNIEKREKAKEWLQNSVLMVVFIQASFFLYELLLNFTSILAKSTLSLINKEFFIFTAENFSNMGMNFFFGLSYVVALLTTVIILAIRYVIIAFGVVAFPIGIFLYFFPLSKNYGKLILNMIITAAIIPFFNVLILLMGSQLLNIEVFSKFKILVMVASFLLLIIVNIMIFSFVIFKSASFLPEGSTKLLTMSVKGF